MSPEPTGDRPVRQPRHQPHRGRRGWDQTFSWARPTSGKPRKDLRIARPKMQAAPLVVIRRSCRNPRRDGEKRDRMARVCRRTHRPAASEVGIPDLENVDGPLGVSDRIPVESLQALMDGPLNEKRNETSGGGQIPGGKSPKLLQLAKSIPICKPLQSNNLII